MRAPPSDSYDHLIYSCNVGHNTWEKLFELAQDQDGYFTMRQAAAQGIKPTTLIQAARRSSLVERRSRGVYRLTLFPTGSGREHLWEAVLWPQVGTDVTAVLSHETALRLHQLSDVNPAEVHITVPKTARLERTVPDWLAVHRTDLAEYDITYVDGLRATAVERTLLDIARSLPQSNVLADAVRDARRRDLPIPQAVLAALSIP